MDNTTLSAPVGAGNTVRDKDRSGTHTQIFGLDLDIGGAAEKLMTSGQKTMADSVPVVLASNQSAVPIDSELPAAAALADASANPTAPAVGGCLLVYNGTTWDRARGDTANGLDVDVTRVSGTVTVTASNLSTNLAQYGGSAVGAANALHVQPGTGAAFPVTDNGGSLTVDGAVAVSGTVTVDSELPAAALLADNAANPTAPAVGAFLMAYDGTTWDRAPGTAADGLLVNLGANNDVTVTGAVTANAGANLNTSLLALEAGGNLAGAAASLGVLDDWDEADRCKINPIVGQAGVAGGSGTAGATTQRVVLATDVALPAGTNAIGKLAANSGVDIGDVDVASVTPGTGAAQLGKSEDAGHAAGAVGVLGLAVRRDANTTLVDADGDYAPLQVDSGGALKVAIISGAGSGGTALADGAVFTPDTTSLTPVGGYRDDTSPATVTEGDAAACRITQNRALHVNLRDASGNEVSVGGGTQYDEDTPHSSGDKLTMGGVVRKDAPASLCDADGDRTALQVSATGRLYTAGDVTHLGGGPVATNTGSASGGTLRVVLATDQPQLTNSLLVTASQATAASLNATVVGGAAHDAAAAGNPLLLGAYASAAAPADVSGDADAVRLWALRNGAQVVNLSAAGALIGGDATNGLDVDVTRVGGNVTVVQSTASSLNVQAVGEVAHDAADSGNPQKLGAKAEDALSGITAVADGDRTNLYADLDGVLIAKLHAAHGDYVSGTASNTDGTSTQCIAAGAAGVKHYLTDVTIANTSASNIYVEIKDGTTVKWVLPVPANGGVTHQFKTPLAGTAATAWNFDPSAAASTVYCSMSAYKSKV